MRNKLAVTLALAILVAVILMGALGGGLAGAVSVPNTGVTVPTVPALPTCPPGTQLLSISNPICVPIPTTPSVPSPPGTGSSPGSGSGSTPGSSGSGSSPSGSGTSTGTATGTGSTSVTATPATAGAGNGAKGGSNGKTGGVGPGKSKHQGRNQQVENKKPPPPYKSNGVPTVSNPTAMISPSGPAPIGVPNFVISQFDIPPFLLPIYQACGTEYDIPWNVLAGINKIETAFGTNLNVSSAGAEGWMQFMPSTWQAYGVDANGDGRKDPYNPVDAICAAARYLRAAGGNNDVSGAVFSYNHASWYVDEVMLAARSYGAIPHDLLGSLTGLTQDDHFPIAAKSSYADDLSARLALKDSTTARKVYGNAANVIQGSPTRRGINIYSKQGAPVVAVNDGTIQKMGKSRKLGRFIVLRDSRGNTFTYAQLGKIARSYPVPKPVEPTAKNLAVTPKAGKSPASPASKRSATPAAPASGGPAAPTGGTAPSGDFGSTFGAVVSKLAAGAVSDGGPAQTSKSGAKPKTNSSASSNSTFEGYFSKVIGLNRKNAMLVPLHKGSHVAGGTVLARVGPSAGGVAPHINFAIQPVGQGARMVDPKPILDGWKLQEATAIYRAAGKYPFAKATDIGGVLLLPKIALERRVLADPRLKIYPCGRHDIITGQVDRRILSAMEFLASQGFRLEISSLKCGRVPLRDSTLVSEDKTGNGMEVSAINGIPVSGHTGKGTLSASMIQTAKQMQGTMRPDQVATRRVPVQRTKSGKQPGSALVHVGYFPTIGNAFYQDPFLNANVVKGRVDQGVDYTGNGPIDAIGTARILSTGAPGWPQGGGVLYKLTDGPRAGQNIFVFEGVVPTVKPGQRVAAGQQIASFAPTGSIEIGFADASGTPLSHGVYREGDVTPWGLKMETFLDSIQGSSATPFTSLLSGPGSLNLQPWDTSSFDGEQVCTYIVPILKAARQLGWSGTVLSGYRSYADQVRIHNSGVYSALPGQSNHEGCAGRTSGPGNGAVDVSDYPSFGAAMAQLGYPLRNTLGSVDPGHFSPGGN